MKRPERQRVILGFLSAIAVLLVVGYAVVDGTRRYLRDQQWVSHSNEVLFTLERVRADVRGAEASQRLYLLMGDARLLDDYQRAREAAMASLSYLQELVSDNAEQVENAQRLQDLVARRFAAAQTLIDTHRTAGSTLSLPLLRDGDSRILSREVDRHITVMESIEMELRGQRLQGSETSSARLGWIATAGIAFSVLVLALIFAALYLENRVRRRAEAEAQQARLDLVSTIGDLQRASGELRQLGEFAGMLQSCRSEAEALAVTRHCLERLLPDCGGTLYLLRASQDHAEAVAHWGTHGATTSQVLAPEDCWALRRGQAYFVPDLITGIRCAHVDPPSGPVASACVPMVAQGISLGFLYVTKPHEGSGTPTGERVPLLIAAAEQLALALFNLRLQETLRVQSIRDPLTGLFNRRYLEESLSREWARCERRGLPLCLLMLDIDHFKRLNDTHGHDAGDAVLRQFAKLLQTRCRTEDIACRYGGEEFALILPEVDRALALRRAEEIRSDVERMQAEHLGKPLGQVTVSIGVALMPADAVSVGELKRAADAALYRAKHNGRNQVASATL